MAFPFAAFADGGTASVPNELSPTDWSSIQQAHARAQYAIIPNEENGFSALNPSQDWQIDFDEDGFLARPRQADWEWGLKLTQYAIGEFQSELTGSTETTWSENNRLSRQHDSILEEWFINDRRGLEQGWTLHQRPAGAGAKDGSVTLALEVRGNLHLGESATENIISFSDSKGDTVLTYSGLKAWDAEGRNLPASFIAHPTGVRIEVDERNAVYPITIDPIAQQAYLKASNAERLDLFGQSVSISGETVAVGAILEDSAARGANGDESDNSAPNSGAVYVFSRINDQWVQQAYLKASNPGDNDNFGLSVSLSGNVLVVGAPYEGSDARTVNGDQRNDNAFNSGAAYVFVRSRGRWRQQAYLKASNSESGDEFGTSVAVSGNTILVGAPKESSSSREVNGDQADNGSNRAGAAYVYVRRGSRWIQQAYLKSLNAATSDQFGAAVALSGDTAVIGAPYEDSDAIGVNGNPADNNKPDSGAAYVFSRSRGVWTQTDYIKPLNTGAGDRFGESLAVSGDTIVIGASWEDSNESGINEPGFNNGATDSGAAYIFVRTLPSWVQQAYVKASFPDDNDRFGFSVGISESGDTVVVGEIRDDSDSTGIGGGQSNGSATDSGAAFVYRRSRGIWTRQTFLKASNTGLDDQFGYSVAVSGDTVVVGAKNEDSDATGIDGDQGNNSADNSGACYLFSGLGRELISLSKTGDVVPGPDDLLFGKPGAAAVGDLGDVLFEQTVSGRDARGGLNRGMFIADDDGVVVPVITNGVEFGGANGFTSPNRIRSLTLPSINQSLLGGLFQLTVGGRGFNGRNNRALVKNLGGTSPLRLTGVPNPDIEASPIIATFTEVLQSFDQDLIVAPYRFDRKQPGVFAYNDTGLLPLDHNGDLYVTAYPYESYPAYEGGTFGQFTGRAAAGFSSGYIDFAAYRLPDSGGRAQQGLFYIHLDGSEERLTAAQGDAPSGLSTGKFRTFFGFCQPTFNTLFLASLSNTPPATNEVLWRGIGASGDEVLRKGTEIDASELPGALVARIVRFWAVGAEQSVIQVLLKGRGVTAANRSALILQQEDGEFLVLMRSGTPAPGFGSNAITVGVMQRIDVNPVTGAYAILGTIRGVAGNANQVLWAGRVGLGDDSLKRHLRLPGPRLRKGDTYTSNGTDRGVIRSISLNPAPDPTGAGGRGLGQVIGPNDHIIVTLTTNRRVRELIKVEP
ncbi:MAG: FG-GAP repeat protein [Verrucomicrobiae bacterium]|nr:FG-GAP repeat protein [Verrucomicrobiae bacterium]